MFLRLDRHLRSGFRLLSQFRPLSMASTPPPFKPFTLALVQLGQIGTDKTGTLVHAASEVTLELSSQLTSTMLVI